MWAIVDTDNFGHDYPDEHFVGEVFEKKEEAEAEAGRLNGTDVNSNRFKKVVALPYKLQPGFEP